MAGTVQLAVTVDEGGRVSDARVLAANPPGVFDQAALDAVRRYKFLPLQRDGKRVRRKEQVTMPFQPPAGQCGKA